MRFGRYFQFLLERPKVNSLSFNFIQLSLASPEKDPERSFGEVKTETINYRTFKPERGDGFSWCQDLWSDQGLRM